MTHNKRLILGVTLVLAGLTIAAIATQFPHADLKMRVLRDISMIVGLCNAFVGGLVLWTRDARRDGSPSV